MANITSNGTGGGNSNDGATWTGGSVPTSSDNAIIQNGDTVTQNAAHTFKSLEVESGGAWTANGTNHLTLSGENDSDFALAINGTFTHANGTVVINNGGGGIAHAAIRAGDATSTTGLYDLTISGGGTTCEIYNSTTIHRNMEAGGATTVLRGALTVNGNLDVVSTLNTQYSSTDYNLTVLGTITVSGTLTCNSSTITNGSASSSAGDLVWSGTINLGTCTFNYYNGSSSNFNLGSCTLGSNTSTVNIIARQTFTGRDTDLTPGSGNLHNLTFSETNSVTGVFNLYSNTTIGGDLTINSGTTLNTSGGSAGDNKSLTVTGDVNIANGGTLTGNASAISMNSLTLGESSAGGTYNATSGTTTITGYRASTNNAIYGNGPIVHNNGTFAFTNSANYSGIEIQIESGAGSAGTYFYNLTFSGNSTYRFPYYGSSDVTVSGDLTMSGTPDIKQWRRNLIVTGDVTIGDGCVYDCEGSGVVGVSSDFTAGSLTIASGGTFKASSDTTTITKTSATAGHSGQPSAIEVVSGGTFTHNSGTVLLSSSLDQDLEFDGTGTLYNLTINKSDNDVIHSSNLTIENDLDVTLAAGHSLRPSSGSNTVTVYGNTYLTTGKIGEITQYTGINNWGLLTINSGEFILSTGTNNVSGIRNIGGTVSQS